MCTRHAHNKHAHNKHAHNKHAHNKHAHNKHAHNKHANNTWDTFPFTARMSVSARERCCKYVSLRPWYLLS
jgi:hypothetical protein